MSGMNQRVKTLIEQLKLEPHPEGGYFREIFRSAGHVSPDDGRGERNALTVIHFLLESGQISRWHRVLSDEAWHFIEGGPLVLHGFDALRGATHTFLLGHHDAETEPVRIIPAGFWQAAEPLGDYTFVSCYVAPGFDFKDFTLAADDPEVKKVLMTKSPKAERLL
jgi:uncharacterized protein